MVAMRPFGSTHCISTAGRTHFTGTICPKFFCLLCENKQYFSHKLDTEQDAVAAAGFVFDTVAAADRVVLVGS